MKEEKKKGRRGIDMNGQKTTRKKEKRSEASSCMDLYIFYSYLCVYCIYTKNTNRGRQKNNGGIEITDYNIPRQETLNLYLYLYVYMERVTKNQEKRLPYKSRINEPPSHYE